MKFMSATSPLPRYKSLSENAWLVVPQAGYVRSYVNALTEKGGKCGAPFRHEDSDAFRVDGVDEDVIQEVLASLSKL
ncbi:hypothetical protein HNQ64_003246 [Prosthecobacter dejongeii]|uniref:Uncharacterized protein n=1 Tax=Prosthecobacter dejongeii TaxID=48465 RepID=A0A7W7YML4_9BACT|nr:hypothetical protein [Prosthecobacter dejongeii]